MSPQDLERVFRGVFLLVLLTSFGISSAFRRRARQIGEVIPRSREGGLYLALRLLAAAPLYLSFLAYMINPEWMAWALVPLPGWLPWIAAAIALGCLPMLYWVFRSLGRNVSETVLTKRDHALVTSGPYRWVRHPLYATAILAFASLALAAANAFMLGVIVLVALAIAFAVVPREEAELEAEFGRSYRVYQRTTGALFPRLGSPSLVGEGEPSAGEG